MIYKILIKIFFKIFRNKKIKIKMINKILIRIYLKIQINKSLKIFKQIDNKI